MPTTITTTLEEVIEQFSTWRSNKKGGEPIPYELWIQVKKLLDSPQYKNSKILRHLGISRAQATGKGILPTIKEKKKPSESSLSQGFLRLSPPSTPLSDSKKIIAMTLQCDDTHVTIENASAEQIQSLVVAFLR